MKKLSNVLCAAVLAVFLASPMVMTSCVTSGNPTAIEQIAAETTDPTALAKAAYIDALDTYNTLGERYMRYMPYMVVNYPEMNQQILMVFKQMDDMLTMWEGFSQIGVIPEEAPDKFASYANMILEIILELEKIEGDET